MCEKSDEELLRGLRIAKDLFVSKIKEHKLSINLLKRNVEKLTKEINRISNKPKPSKLLK